MNQKDESRLIVDLVRSAFLTMTNEERVTFLRWANNEYHRFRRWKDLSDFKRVMKPRQRGRRIPIQTEGVEHDAPTL